MDKNQISRYESCKNYLTKLLAWKEKLPFGNQQYGGGTGSPMIEGELQDIHSEMFYKIREAMDEAKSKVEKLIEEL